MVLRRKQISGNPRLDSRLNRLLIDRRANLVDERWREKPKVVVQIVLADAVQPSQIEVELERLGGRLTGCRRSGRIVQALVPLSALDVLSRLPMVDYIRTPCAALPLSEMVSEGVHDIGANLWHESGLRGQGVRVGVIDVGFVGYQDLLGSELPRQVETHNFVDGEASDAIDVGSSHGTACAEIIYDLAPAAEFYLARVSSEIDLQEAVDWLAVNCRVDIISTALGWYNLTPGDGTGVLADIVAGARSAGIFWATAAGNDRMRHWDGGFVDYDGDGILDFSRGRNINYFGDENGNAYLLEPGYRYTVYVRWSDWVEVKQDYDIYIYRWSDGDWGNPIASSVDLQNGTPGQTPAETVEFVTSGEPAAYGFIIYRALPETKPVDFEVFVPFAPMLVEFTTQRSLPNLADVPAAMTVAAVNAGGFQLEDYSSEGPTNGPGGTLVGGQKKPDIAAYTNVTTATYSWYGFTGTSAATAHVAGAAVLQLADNPNLSPEELSGSLLQQVIEINGSGFDYRTGWGRLHLDAPDTPPPAGPTTWLGSTDSTWERSANWSSGRLPIAGELVVIPTVAGYRQPRLSSTGYAGQLFLSGCLTVVEGGRLVLR
jgi:subtilisin family serine protease